ncbi:MAG: hypothetical protein ACE5GM_00690 [bacterium]
MELKQDAASERRIAGLSAVGGTALFTILLFFGKISEATYVVLLGLLAVVSIVLYDFSRVREIVFSQNRRIVLDPVAEIKPGYYEDKITGDKIGISVTSDYSIVRVNEKEYYFIRESGEFDRIGKNVD